MVSKGTVHTQLKQLGFKVYGWGKGEVSELENIILPDEVIYEVANGLYEGGFALLLATDIRVLLVDKKPLNYLTVEDLRFDMINEIDYSHRLLGATITITTGNRTLRFRSYNQPRLRKLIGHVQHCMAEIKKKQTFHAEGQHQHLDQINKQLQAYLIAQQKQQQELYAQLQDARTKKGLSDAVPKPPEPIKPDPALADYLYAQGLMDQYRQETGQTNLNTDLPKLTEQELVMPAIANKPVQAAPVSNQPVDLYNDGMKEIFGKHQPASVDQVATNAPEGPKQHTLDLTHPLEINAMKVAYSKLPMAMRNRRFGRPSFHAYSKQLPNLNQNQPADI